MAFSISYPFINGHRYSFASLQVILNGLPYVGLTSLNYSTELEPADLYSTDPQKIGRTRGKKQDTCDMEMYALEWEILKRSLGVAGVGFGETAFDIIAQYSEGLSAPVITDSIIGARVTKVEKANSEGNEPSKVKITLNVIEILLDNVPIAAPISLGF